MGAIDLISSHLKHKLLGDTIWTFLNPKALCKIELKAIIRAGITCKI